MVKLIICELSKSRCINNGLLTAEAKECQMFPLAGIIAHRAGRYVVSLAKSAMTALFLILLSTQLIKNTWTLTYGSRAQAGFAQS